ncbi:DUF411 domain-containing protein [Marinobacterium aestuariivivens]|uniref:DUF411 domain-containing protein n=1 Tax=Marinobacterium aestuariivivens TaxID=1698799 RepID=A0ABW1ZZB5_9GAMM
MKKLNSLVLALGLSLAGLLQAGEAPTGTLYKNPQCGCCSGHADYLRAQGFEIEVIESDRLSAFKREQDVPQALESCHTLLIDGYVIEGHVPVASIRRLLTERPDIRGIALPGMPAGSPGMGGAKSGPFSIYELNGGMPKVYATE